MKEFTYTKTITEQQVDDLMESALTGITYWADRAEIKDDDMGAYYISQGISKGYTLRIHDMEENEWHELTLEKLLKGLALSVTFNADDFDQNNADAVVQYALFGKVIYG